MDPVRLVSHARLVAALEEHSHLESTLDVGADTIRIYRGVPGQPGMGVTVYPPDATGQCEVELDSAHASLEAVMRAVGIRFEPPGTIRKHTPTTEGYVVSEPARPPSGGAANQWTRSETEHGERPPSDADYVKADPPAQGKPSGLA